MKILYLCVRYKIHIFSRRSVHVFSNNIPHKWIITYYNLTNKMLFEDNKLKPAARTKAWQTIHAPRRGSIKQIRTLSKPTISISTITDTSDEESLKKTLKSKKHKILIRLIYWLLRLGSIELSLNRTQTSQLSQTQQFHTGKWASNSQTNYYPTIRFKLFSVAYGSISNILISAIQFVMIIIFFRVSYLIVPLVKIQRLWILIAPRISKPNSTQCDIFYESPNSQNTLSMYLKTRDDFELNGGSSQFEPVTLLVLAGGSVFFFCFWFANYFLVGKKGLVIDVLDFMIDPIKARYNFDAELAKIVSSLKTSIHYLSVFQSDFHKSTSMSLGNIYQKNPKHSLPSRNTIRDRKYQQSRAGDPSNGVIETLHELKKFNLIRPANLTCSWLRQVDNSFASLLYPVIVLQLVWPAFAIFVCQLGHIEEETRNRIIYLRCKDLYPNRTIHRNLLGCQWNQQKHLNTDQLNLYRYQSPSDLIGMLELIIEDSLYRCVTRRSLLSSLQFYLSLFYFSINFTFITLIYTITHIDKYKWISEIEAQIAEACDYLENPNFRTALFNKSEHKLDQNDNHQIVSMKLLLPYINYSLFCSRHVHFRRFNDILNIKITAANLMLLSILYFTVLHAVNGLRPTLVGGLFLVVLSINALSMYPSIFIKRMLKLRKTIAKLVRIGQSSQMEIAIQMSLWRNQLLEESELVALYAQRSILGHLSFYRLITINAYLMAIWIVIFKTN